MANITLTEQALVEALQEWTSKQGVVLSQVNPHFFMQILRERGLEIVKSEELIKIRYEQKYLREEVNKILRAATAAKTKIEQLDENKDLLRDLHKSEPAVPLNAKANAKSTPRKP
jgi:hypothetical protein